MAITTSDVATETTTNPAQASRQPSTYHGSSLTREIDTRKECPRSLVHLGLNWKTLPQVLLLYLLGIPSLGELRIGVVDPGFPFRLTPMSFALRVTNSP